MPYAIREDTWLMGTGCVHVPTTVPFVARLPAPVRLRAAGKEVFASARAGEAADAVVADRLLMDLLGCREGDEVEVELVDVAEAKRVVLGTSAERVGAELTEVLRPLMQGLVVQPGQVLRFAPLTSDYIEVVVEEVEPSPAARMEASTQILLQASDTPYEAHRHVTFADVGGLEAEGQQLRELVEAPFRYARVYHGLGVDLVQGILLAGPPGTGKTLLTRALANELGVHTEVILGAEVYSGIYGQTESVLRKTFENALAHQPALIIIDEIDALAPRREAVAGEQERRVVATLATMFDRLRGRQVVVLATTNRPDALDPALRRPGRLEREINLVAPGKQQRLQILQLYIERYRRAGRLGDVNLEAVAEETYGYVGADLAAVVRQAGLIALRRCVGGDVQALTPLAVAEVVITQQDLVAAIEAQPPSALRELRVELPERITWDDIGGLEEVKRELQETLVHGLRHPEVFRQLGQRPLRGVLFYGPPGTGKTLLAKAVANAGQANFISVRGPELRSRWFGESEAKVREVFAKARQTRPCVVFFDELDALAPPRGRSVTEAADSIVNQLLAEMDGLATVDGVLVLGATNRPELLDQALLRPGRFDHHIHIPLPDRTARVAILGVHRPQMPFAEEAEAYMQVLADYTEGYSGADLAELMRKACTSALRRCGWLPESCRMERSDLEEALTQMRRQKARIEGLGSAEGEAR